jgi:dihydroorotate dehydrogenase electron transfer subunit
LEQIHRVNESTNATETGRLLGSTALPGGYQLLRLQLPQLSQTVAAGQQLRIGEILFPVMRHHSQQQWIEVLSTTSLPWAAQNSMLHCELVGEPFHLPGPGTVLLIAEELGLAPITFLTETLKKEPRHSLLVLLGFKGAIPFRPAPSRIMINHLPSGVIATMPLLEDWSIPCRIAHVDEPPGCFGGTVLELARHWLRQQPGNMTESLYISGDREMVKAGISLAGEFNLGYQAIETGAG